MFAATATPVVITRDIIENIIDGVIDSPDTNVTTPTPSTSFKVP